MRALRPGAALFPLRLFLGLTFVYAGVQKLSDPAFLHAGSPTYIGAQLEGFANGTPGGFLLNTFALPHPDLAGVGVAIFEIVVGLLVTAGLITRLAAAAGLGLNLVFFLTASWHTSPYFLGSDIVFVFAWLPFVLSGASGQPALDNMLEHPPESLTRRTRLHPPEPGTSYPDTPDDASMTRRALVAEVAAFGLGIAGVAALLKGPYTGSTATARALGAGKSSAGGGSGAGGPTASTSNPPSAAGGPGPGAARGLPSGAVKLGPGRRLPKGQAATYSDPAEGAPDILIRDTEGNLKAFSAVCTHAGCTVGYSEGRIICPCHGGEFSAETGEVLAGPPPTPLAPKQVLEQGGQIYAVPS
jgi:thiosulfate dehydrogenase [quinone] large subunit